MKNNYDICKIILMKNAFTLEIVFYNVNIYTSHG